MYLFIKEPVSDDDDDKRLTHFKTRAAKGLARAKRIEALETENNNLRDEKFGFTRVMKRKKKTATISSPEATSSLKVKNQFEVLSSEQEDEEEIYETKVKSSTFSQKEIAGNNNIKRSALPE